MTLTPDSISAIRNSLSRKQEEKKKPASNTSIVVALSLLLLFVVILSAIGFYALSRQVRILHKKTKQVEQVFANLQLPGVEFLPVLGNLSLPIQLQTTPLAEKAGLVIDTKKIAIRGVDAPYNPSMIERDGGYLLVFRYDVIQHHSACGFFPCIGCCELDANFEQTEKEFVKIDTGSKFSEDPRVIQKGQEIYLMFNDKDGTDYRTMHIGKLNLQEAKLEFSTSLDLHIKAVEKNWVPFEYIENGKPEIYLEYYLNPQKIMKLPNPEVNELTHLRFSSSEAFHRQFWPHIWGEPRGGSPARLIDDEQYLGFFHSFFTDNLNFAWYVMGAYTFSKEPPFHVTAISHYPMLFEGIYDSPHMNTSEPRKRVLFPGGFTEGTRNGKKVFYVCCGENDSSIKLITIDKEILLNTLKPL